MDQLRKLTISFAGTKRKGVAFRGWAGPMVKRQEETNSWNGGSVTFYVKPYALVMWGANGPGMRSCDKATKFAFAGLCADAILWAYAIYSACPKGYV